MMHRTPMHTRRRWVLLVLALAVGLVEGSGNDKTGGKTETELLGAAAMPALATGSGYDCEDPQDHMARVAAALSEEPNTSKCQRYAVRALNWGTYALLILVPTSMVVNYFWKNMCYYCHHKGINLEQILNDIGGDMRIDVAIRHKYFAMEYSNETGEMNIEPTDPRFQAGGLTLSHFQERLVEHKLFVESGLTIDDICEWRYPLADVDYSYSNLSKYHSVPSVKLLSTVAIVGTSTMFTLVQGSLTYRCLQTPGVSKGWTGLLGACGTIGQVCMVLMSALFEVDVFRKLHGWTLIGAIAGTSLEIIPRAVASYWVQRQCPQFYNGNDEFPEAVPEFMKHFAYWKQGGRSDGRNMRSSANPRITMTFITLAGIFFSTYKMFSDAPSEHLSIIFMLLAMVAHNFTGRFGGILGHLNAFQVQPAPEHVAADDETPKAAGRPKLATSLSNATIIDKPERKFSTPPSDSDGQDEAETSLRVDEKQRKEKGGAVRVLD